MFVGRQSVSRTGVPAAVWESLSGEKLLLVRDNSEGGIRNELGNGALGMYEQSKLCFPPTVCFVFCCRCFWETEMGRKVLLPFSSVRLTLTLAVSRAKLKLKLTRGAP